MLTIPLGSVSRSLDHSFPSHLSFKYLSLDHLPSQLKPLSTSVSVYITFASCLCHCWSAIVHDNSQLAIENLESNEVIVIPTRRSSGGSHHQAPATTPSTAPNPPHSLSTQFHIIWNKKLITEEFLADRWFSQSFLVFQKSLNAPDTVDLSTCFAKSQRRILVQFFLGMVLEPAIYPRRGSLPNLCSTLSANLVSCRASKCSEPFGKLVAAFPF